MAQGSFFILYIMENIVENKWVPVSEKMPEIGKTILFIEDNKGHITIHIGCIYNNWNSIHYGMDGNENITHWMPIPELPTT